MPEKCLNEIPKAVREQYEKGVLAFERRNLDYAISLLTQVLQTEPGFFEARQALRAAQFKNAGEGAGFFKKVWGSASSSPLVAKGQLALRKNPVDALGIAEQLLTSDPNSATANKLMAEAALACDFPRTAMLSLEIVVRNSAKDTASAWKLAEVYTQLGEIGKAEEVYNQLAAEKPDDPDLQQALKNLAASRTLSEGGYEALADGSGSYRDILRNKEEAESLEQANRQMKDEDVTARLLRECEEQIAREPKNLKLLRSAAELCSAKKQYDRALEYYGRIVSMEGETDPSLQRLMVETMSRKMDYALGELDPRSSDYAERAEVLTKERDEYVLREQKSLAERYPNDLQIRFDLGIQYFRAGRTSEAIQEFQKTQNNPHRRIQSLNYLGQCFARRGMNDLAARTFQNALKEKVGFDEERKELIYGLGSVLATMGSTEAAMEQFKQIYEVDIGYRDVAARVDAHYEAKPQS